LSMAINGHSSMRRFQQPRLTIRIPLEGGAL
jgi:hypothetical protein